MKYPHQSVFILNQPKMLVGKFRKYCVKANAGSTPEIHLLLTERNVLVNVLQMIQSGLQLLYINLSCFSFDADRFDSFSGYVIDKQPSTGWQIIFKSEFIFRRVWKDF